MLLRDFAFTPPKSLSNSEDWLDYVAKFATKEKTWGQDNRYLERYLDYNFEIAYAQGKVVEAPDRSFALWRAGNLMTPDNEPISILCTKNRKAGKQPYYFVRVFNTRRVEVSLNGERSVVTVPEAPEYFPPKYEPGYELGYQFSHYLEDNRDRAEERLPGLSDRQRFLCIYAAAMLSHRRGRRAAVPQWYRDKNAPEGSYQWLLPLHINTDDFSAKPDLVATLQPDELNKEYKIRTLLPPEWAYPNARSITVHDAEFRIWAD